MDSDLIIGTVEFGRRSATLLAYLDVVKLGHTEVSDEMYAVLLAYREMLNAKANREMGARGLLDRVV